MGFFTQFFERADSPDQWVIIHRGMGHYYKGGFNRRWTREIEEAVRYKTERYANREAYALRASGFANIRVVKLKEETDD